MHYSNSYKTVLNPQLVPADPEKPTFSVDGDSLVITSGDIRLTLTNSEACSLSTFIERHLGKSWFNSFLHKTEAPAPKSPRCYAVEA